MDWSKESVGIILASIIGAFIGTATKRDTKPLSMIVSVVAGISSAYIFTPLIVAHWGWSTPVHNAIAFLLGLLGMSIITIVLAVLDALKDEPKEIIGMIKSAISFFSRDKTTIINNYKEEDK
jgi:uncharacterized membrane protein YeaQ/YmgE (transglycosylase-associated protein family)